MAIRMGGLFQNPVGLRVPNVAPTFVVLSEETGTYGNVALIGTNGLTASNYSASTVASSVFTARGAFDGHNYLSEVINSDQTLGKQDSGAWQSVSGENTNQWLQVDFGQNIKVSGFRYHINGSAPSDKIPRDIIVQTSTDGVTFTNSDSQTLPQDRDQVITLGSPIITRYFRLFMVNNYGNSQIQVGELEVFQV